MEKSIEGKHVYGGAIVARLTYVVERHGPLGLKELFGAMKERGYTGPQEIDEFKFKVKYPMAYFISILECYKEIHGAKALSRMSRSASRRHGIVGWFLRWAGTPELLLRKASEYWPEFYDFGELKGEVLSPTTGRLTGIGIYVGDVFCESLTDYFKGIFDNLKMTSFEVEHTHCPGKGDDRDVWNIRWEK